MKYKVGDRVITKGAGDDTYRGTVVAVNEFKQWPYSVEIDEEYSLAEINPVVYFESELQLEIYELTQTFDISVDPKVSVTLGIEGYNHFTFKKDEAITLLVGTGDSEQTIEGKILDVSVDGKPMQLVNLYFPIHIELKMEETAL
jgi:hypothetical protein